MNAVGETWKNFASLSTWSLVSDRAPVSTAEIVDCEILTSFASPCLGSLNVTLCGVSSEFSISHYIAVFVGGMGGCIGSVRAA